MNEDIFIIDRIEGNYVIVENKNGCMCEVLCEDVLGNFKEGDILVKSKDKYKVDEQLTNKRKLEVEDMVNDMWK